LYAWENRRPDVVSCIREMPVAHMVQIRKYMIIYSRENIFPQKKTAINTPEVRPSAINKGIRNFLLNPTVQIACIIILGMSVIPIPLTSPFVFDDVAYVIENPAVKDVSVYLSASQNDSLPTIWVRSQNI